MQKIIWAIFSLMVFSIFSSESFATTAPTCKGVQMMYNCVYTEFVVPSSLAEQCVASKPYGGATAPDIKNKFRTETCSTPGKASYFCDQDCSCPPGTNWVNGACELPPCEGNAERVNGQCPSVGQSCPQGTVNQGTVNGSPVCGGTCSDPAQFYGTVNGVTGCWGAPTCTNGGSFGTVNGVPGCWGADSGSNSSSGSGTSSGSNGSSGAGTSSGSNGSSGSGGSGGGNNGGDNGGGSNGGGSGGGSSGGGNNNSPGVQYPEDSGCPMGFTKDGKYCVRQGDCPTGYHELVVSADPFFAMCVKNNSFTQSSSPPISSASASSRSSSSSSSNANISAGSNSSTGNGGGGGGSGGGGSTGGGSGDPDQSGQCDPKATNYLDCLTGGGKPMPDHMQTGSGKNSVGDINQDFKNRLNNSAVVRSFDRMKNFVQLGSTSCPDFSISIDYFNKTLSTTVHCTIWSSIKSYLSLVMMCVWAFIAFRIFASA